MPEGHTVHAYARDHSRLLGGRPVRARSPQGRFAAGAAHVDDAVLERVDAHGKHLFYRFAAPAPVTVHVHLGLYGRFRTFPAAAAPPPTPGTRLELLTAETVVRLAGAAVCELLDPHAERALRDRLGPDPLRPRTPSTGFVAALSRRRSPLGAVLLDQSVIAGVGNVYRAEALFLAGLWPQRHAAALSREQALQLWVTVRDLLRAGLRDGRIVTVSARDNGGRRPRRRADTLYVYGRAGQPCRRCGSPIAGWTLAARTIFACPVCQPPQPAAVAAPPAVPGH